MTYWLSPRCSRSQVWTHGQSGSECLRLVLLVQSVYFYAEPSCKIREECHINIWLMHMFYTVHFLVSCNFFLTYICIYNRPKQHTTSIYNVLFRNKWAGCGRRGRPLGKREKMWTKAWPCSRKSPTLINLCWRPGLPVGLLHMSTLYDHGNKAA